MGTLGVEASPSLVQSTYNQSDWLQVGVGQLLLLVLNYDMVPILRMKNLG